MNGTGALVYVVDDDESARDGVARLIRSAGFVAKTFKSGEEFLATPRPNLPSCLILDVNLPGLNGFDLQRKLAESRPRVPIVFLTGHGDIPMTVRAVKAGAANFLTKPVDEEALLDAIRHCVDSWLGDEVQSERGVGNMIVESPALQAILRNMRLEGRVEERTRIARELHDTLLQSVQGLMFSFQAARNLLPGRTEEAIRTLDGAIRKGDEAIAEGRDAIQGLRANPALESDLEHQFTAAGKELARSSTAEGEPPAFQVAVEGARQPLSPLLQDELYPIALEILRNAFHHARASRLEVEIAYDSKFFRLRIRDNGKGIDRKVLEAGSRQGHWGLPGVRERAKRIGARLKIWSEPGAGTEAELIVPARIAYRTSQPGAIAAVS